MRRLQSYVHLSRSGVFAHLLVGLSVSITSSWAQAGPMDVVDQIDIAIWRHYLDDLLYTHVGDNRARNMPQHDLARDNIEATLRSFGLDTYLDPFQVGGPTYYNIVAIKPGLVTPDQQYIISGHYDSVGNPGADDDASGCAVVMEIARVLARYPFESTIIFIAFDYEEGGPGREGSTHYANAHQDNDIRGMIAIDMIAHNVNLGVCDIFGREESNDIKLALGQAVETYSDGLTGRVQGDFNCCDHNPFEALGIPACVIVEGDGPWGNPCYHQSCDSIDTPGNIDYSYAVQVTRSVAGYLVEHAGLMAVPGDYDGDSDVDLVDFKAFLTCFTGPDHGPYFPTCQTFDSDSDDDIDFGDFGALQFLFTGP
ncbi:MAG: M28 family peptidase [Planctomycetes bacterium]|nr:M28 family peptidase [Planctomycetota bacterium]